jgi:multidrug efflux system outer membrane protein
MTRRPFPASIAARLAPATLLVLLAGGCVSLAPDYHRPALPVPATYAAGDSGAAAATAAADIGWQTYFPDPVLQGLIATALDNNRDLRNALLRVEEARGRYGNQPAAPVTPHRAPAARARPPPTRHPPSNKPPPQTDPKTQEKTNKQRRK